MRTVRISHTDTRASGWVPDEWKEDAPLSDYCKVFARIWNDLDFTALDGDCQRLYLMLLSYPTRDNAGVLPLTLRRWVTATAGATIETLAGALERLAERRFIVIDWNTEEVLIRSMARNDETYRQPKLWVNAMKSARQIQSPLLRGALADELSRLPEHREGATTEDTTKALLEGLPKGYREGYAEGYREGYAIPPGVGALRSNRMHQAPTPAPSPAPVRARDPHADGRAATPAADLVRDIVPDTHPKATLTALRHQASELLHEGTNPDLVAEALRLWCGKPSVGNGRTILASMVSEVVKARAAPPRRSTADDRVMETQALKAKYQAAENDIPTLTIAPMGELA